jgi:hypothetical protein
LPPVFVAGSSKKARFLGQDMDQFPYNFGGPRSFRHLVVGHGALAIQLRRLLQLTLPPTVCHCGGRRLHRIQYIAGKYVNEEKPTLLGAKILKLKR